MAQDRVRNSAVTEVWECTGIRFLDGLTSSLFLSMQLGWEMVPEIAESPGASHQPAKALDLQPIGAHIQPKCIASIAKAFAIRLPNSNSKT